MSYSILAELLEARSQGIPCVLIPVANAQGSVPRQAGMKMIVYASGKISGTIGGGRAEALVVQDALRCLETGEIELKRTLYAKVSRIPSERFAEDKSLF